MHYSKMLWLLLIYTLPAHPSRKRALVWRKLKKLGVVYLRDGVCALPDRVEAARELRVVATSIEQLGGRATLVEAARLDSRRAAEIVAESRAARAAEYAELAREAERFLDYVRAEGEHRELGPSERQALQTDLDKLKLWAQQIEARDHFGTPRGRQVPELFARCDELFARPAAAALPQEVRR